MKDENKHQKILQAAVKVFSEKGFYNSRVSEIAKEANVADGTIYLYFKNKDDILISLFEEKFGRFVKDMRKELEKEKDVLQKIKSSRSPIYPLSPSSSISVKCWGGGAPEHQIHERIHQQALYRISQPDSVRGHRGAREGAYPERPYPGSHEKGSFWALDEMARYWVLSTKKKHSVARPPLQISDVFIRGMMSEEARKNYPWPL